MNQLDSVGLFGCFICLCFFVVVFVLVLFVLVWGFFHLFRVVIFFFPLGLALLAWFGKAFFQNAISWGGIYFS